MCFTKSKSAKGIPLDYLDHRVQLVIEKIAFCKRKRLSEQAFAQGAKPKPEL